MTGHVVPLDSISVEVVEDGQAGLLRWRILPSSSVVRLGKTSSEIKKLLFKNFVLTSSSYPPV